MRLQVNFLCQRHDRVRRPVAADGKSRVGSLEHARAAGGLVPAQEKCPVVFMLSGHFTSKFNQQRMDQDNRFFVRRTPATLEQQRIFARQVFTFDKKFVESRVAPVNRLRGQHHLAVTGQFQPPGAVALIQNVYPSDFDAIRADCDPRAQGDAMVRTLELHLVRIEQHFLAFRRTSDRLAGGRPEFAALRVLDIDPCTPLVQAGVGLPTGQSHLSPLAVSASGVGDQHAGVAL